MIITCPYCGPRDLVEFSYQGDGNRTRPDPASTDQAAWNDYVYDRINTAGDHREIWQHAGGCRAHLTVVRSTLTHEIRSVALTRDAGHRRSGGHRRAEAGDSTGPVSGSAEAKP